MPRKRRRIIHDPREAHKTSEPVKFARTAVIHGVGLDGRKKKAQLGMSRLENIPPKEDYCT
jgi:hypothetical protein